MKRFCYTVLTTSYSFLTKKLAMLLCLVLLGAVNGFLSFSLKTFFMAVEIADWDISPSVNHFKLGGVPSFHLKS